MDVHVVNSERKPTDGEDGNDAGQHDSRPDVASHLNVPPPTVGTGGGGGTPGTPLKLEQSWAMHR